MTTAQVKESGYGNADELAGRSRLAIARTRQPVERALARLGLRPRVRLADCELRLHAQQRSDAHRLSASSEANPQTRVWVDKRDEEALIAAIQQTCSGGSEDAMTAATDSIRDALHKALPSR